MTRNGKIARLPKPVRDTLNRRLRDGEPGKRLVEWLNTLPEAKAVLAAEFGGRPVTEQNLSEWKLGGHREWLVQQEALEQARNLAEHAGDLRETAGAVADHLAVVLSSRYAAALADWEGDPESGLGRKLRVLRSLCQDVVELRRGDHSAARLKIEQARLAAEQEKTEEELLEHFNRCAQNPKVRATLCGCELTKEEREQRMRQIFGLEPAGQAGGIRSTKADNRPNELAPTGESDPIRPNPALPSP